MRILIFGSGGQLGQALQKECISRELDFYALTSGQVDISKIAELIHACEKTNPKIIINCAAYTNVDSAEIFRDEAYKTNVQGLQNVLEIAKRNNAYLVHLSSDYVFSGKSSKVWEVESVREPLNYYGITKVSAENLIMENYPEKSYIFRTSGLYGSHKENIATFFLKIAMSEIEIAKAANDQFSQPTSTTELSRRILDCIFMNVQPGVYHATSSGSASWYDFAKKIFELSNSNMDRLKPVSMKSFVRQAERPAFSVLSDKCWGEAGLTQMLSWEASLENEIGSILRFIGETSNNEN